MADDVSPELQQKIAQLQQLAGQLQQFTQQRQQMEMMQSESKRAKEAIEAAGDAPIYRAVGGLMIQDDAPKALERLTDDLETLEIRVKRLREQEGSMEKNLESLQKEIQTALEQ